MNIPYPPLQILTPSFASPCSGTMALHQALRAFEQADVLVDLLPDADAALQAPGPLLLFYPSPDQALASNVITQKDGGPLGNYNRLLDLVSELSRRPETPEFRMVNLSLSSMPGVISWAMDALTNALPAQGSQPEGIKVEPDLWFRPQPDPIDALITLQVLEHVPEVQSTYLALEEHPKGAAADQRQPDRAYAQRLQAAASLPNLLQARQAAAASDQQLRNLGAQLGAARADLIDAAWIREQLAEQIHQMQEQLRVQDLKIAEDEGRSAEIQHLQARLAEAQANQAEIQTSLEQAVRCSRSQRDLHAAMALVIRKLLAQIGRMQGG